MSIIRAPRPQSNFYLLNKSISEDRRLSWAARGLLVFLLGKPDHWKVSTQALINETGVSEKPAGRDAVRALVNELILAGYIDRIPVRGEQGKMAGYDYLVSEVSTKPDTPIPETDQPGTDQPETGNPAPVVHPQVSIEKTVSIEEQQESANALLSSPSDDDATMKGKRKEVAPVDELVKLYNRELGDRLANALRLTAKRKSAITARWHEMLNSESPDGSVRYFDRESGLAWWAKFLKKVRMNPHWMGDNDRGWRADLDWIVNPNNFVKILEYRKRTEQ